MAFAQRSRYAGTGPPPTLYASISTLGDELYFPRAVCAAYPDAFKGRLVALGYDEEERAIGVWPDASSNGFALNPRTGGGVSVHASGLIAEHGIEERGRFAVEWRDDRLVVNLTRLVARSGRARE